MADAEIYAKLEAAIRRRCPAMLAAKALGVVPSIDEAFFMSSIIEDEEKKAGLPKHWMLGQMIARMDHEEAKTRPYKCARCGSRYTTSDKRNACACAPKATP